MAGNEWGAFPEEAPRLRDDNAADGPDLADSTDYDPSALNPFSPAPLDRSPPSHEDVLSPAAASIHQLPPKPQALQPSFAASLPSILPTTTQSQPRMRGGFEMDDDVDDDEEEREDQDSVAVYEPDDGLAESYTPEQDMDQEGDDAAATSNQHFVLDSTSKSPVLPNGLAHVPAHTNGVNHEASGFVPSPNVTIHALPPQRASTATPMQSNTESAVGVVPASLPMNTSHASNTAFASAVPKGRLAHDVVGILEDRIKEDPRGDVLAWLELVEELKRRNKQDEVRQLYDRYFEVFLLAVS